MPGKSRPNAGFTLIEVIIVVLLIGIAAALVLPRGPEAARSAALDSETQKLAGVLRLAREKAMAGNLRMTVMLRDAAGKQYAIVDENGVVHGKTVTVDDGVTLKNMPAVGIEFRPGGEPSQPVSLILETTGSNRRSRTIEVNRLGITDIK